MHQLSQIDMVEVEMRESALIGSQRVEVENGECIIWVTVWR